MKNQLMTEKKGRIVKVLNQVGKSNTAIDKTRSALLPGKRISRNDKVYWETRKNRSDKAMQKV